MFKFGDQKKRLYKKLCKAATDGDLAAVKALVEEGADVNGPGRQPPLFNAAYTANGAECVRYLLEKGAIVDAVNSVHCTALMGAASRGNLESVKLLLEAGADTSLRGNRNNNALDWAMQGRHLAVVSLLSPPPVSVPAATEPPRVEAAHEVTLSRRLGNRVLEEIFDFAAHERITLVRTGDDGPVEAITRDGFSQIEDKARLREAFAAYVKKGGTADESEFFPDRLVKPSLQKPAPGGA